MRTVAIIQARMGSSRFPGKILRSLAGKPLLWHIITRLRRSRELDEIVVATTEDPDDDETVRYCKGQGVTVVRGSSEHVLSRYQKAARESRADLVVRVTGDAPLVDPEFLDRMVQEAKKTGADRVTADTAVPCLHEGFSVLTRGVLEWLASSAADDPVAKEHVTGYFQKDQAGFQVAQIPVPEDVQVEGKISVDTPADLAFLETVHERLKAAPGEVQVSDVARLLREDPELRRLNDQAHRKGIDTGHLKVLVRCDASAQVGYGHLSRCMALAQELRDSHMCGVVFAMDVDDHGARQVESAGFKLHRRGTGDKDEDDWFSRVAKKISPDVLLLDLRSDLDPGVVQGLREKGVLVATLDDPSPRRLVADLAFYPPVPQVRIFDWTGFTGELLSGWQWIPLRSGFKARTPPQSRKVPLVIISMGGSDPQGLTERVLEALANVDGPFEASVVLGPGFDRDPPAVKGLSEDQSVRFLREVGDLAPLLADADLAVVSFGVTAFEAAAVGTPSVYLCLSDSHEMAAGSFEEAGAGISLGRHDKLGSDQVSETISRLLSDPKRRETMGKKAAGLPLTEGTARIAKRIVGACEQMRRDGTLHPVAEAGS